MPQIAPRFLTYFSPETPEACLQRQTRPPPWDGVSRETGVSSIMQTKRSSPSASTEYCRFVLQTGRLASPNRRHSRWV